jgi:ribosomal protein L11 methylase PrmA
MIETALSSSFRDPSGFLFIDNATLYRQVNHSYQENYDLLMGSGLYQKLTGMGLMVGHDEAPLSLKKTDDAYKIIRPEEVPFISYPYEWCFSQLKDGALATLKIQKTSLDFGMSLKDSSAYNVQFVRGKPVLIDTLSFEKYDEGKPWVAYRQFCQHFLAPLALESYVDIRFGQLSRVYIDGVPLDLASSLLPLGSRFRFGLLSHIHLHAKSQKRYADKSIDAGRARKVSRLGFLGIIDSLESTVRKLNWAPRGTEWADYYEDTNYSSEAFREKQRFLSEVFDRVEPKDVWDIGGNTGVFSRVASDRGIPTVSYDIDPSAVEVNYRECRKREETHILPLLLDLTNPSPAIGWENRERMSFGERGPADIVLALALVHHLAISNNLPLGKIAAFFSRLSHRLVIEFVPKDDSQVQRLLRTRKDIFPHYTREAFEAEFQKFFEIIDKRQLADSSRIIYLMTSHG